jgi:hypothetical protein
MGHKKQTRKKILSRLERSMAQVQPVSIVRSVKPGVERHGVVQEIGDEWVLMAAIRDGGYLNGYMAVRLDTIRHVRADRGLEDFLRQGPGWPPARLSPASTASPTTSWKPRSKPAVFCQSSWRRSGPDPSSWASR